MGPVSSHAPLTGDIASRLAGSRLVERQDRRLLEGLARHYVDHPTDVALAAELLIAGRRSGRIDWLRAFAVGSERRLPTAATQFLLAEVGFASQGYEAGLGTARAAHLAAPHDTEIGIAYAAALAGTGKVFEAYSSISDWVLESARWAGLSEQALQRLATVTGAIAPGSLGDRITTAWLTKSWETGDASERARALAFASSLAARRDEDTAALDLAGASLEHAQRSAITGDAVAAVMNGAEITKGDEALVSQFESICQLVPTRSRAAKSDCLASALQRSLETGAFQTALHLYEEIRAHPMSNPLLAMRVGRAAIPLLEMYGAYGESASLAEHAFEAALKLGNLEMRQSFLVRLARAKRLAGDYLNALGVARMAENVPATSGALRARAHFEVVAAQRTLAGGENATATAGDSFASGLQSAPDRPLVLEPVSSVDGLPPRPGIRDPRAILALARRARSVEAEGDSAAALRLYLDVIVSVRDTYATLTGDLVLAARVTDVWADISRRALGLALRGGDPELALQILEGTRGLSPGDRASFSLAALKPRAGAAVLAYALGPRQSWVIVVGGAQGLELLELPLSTPALRSRLTLWRELAKNNRDLDRWTAMSDSLRSALLGPVESAGLLDGITHLYIIPDDVLHLLSFAALDAAVLGPGRPARLLTQAPSIVSLRRSLERATRGGPVVAFSTGGGAGSLDEMHTVAQVGGRGFVGRRATETEWRRQAHVASVIHFGGHSTPPGSTAGTPALMLVADSQTDGILTIAEILAAPLPGSMVVLLGCDTAMRSEEPGPAAHFLQTPSLADAFLSAGARSVVGNLWSITEEDARLLANEFYRAGGASRGAVALETARATLRRRYPGMPRRWAGAVWLGAPAPDGGSE
jgi:CHAT domain-containing protein